MGLLTRPVCLDHVEGRQVLNQLQTPGIPNNCHTICSALSSVAPFSPGNLDNLLRFHHGGLRLELRLCAERNRTGGFLMLQVQVVNRAEFLLFLYARLCCI